MKQNAIDGLNKIGKIGLIFTVVLSLISYVFMIYAIGITIMLHNAPASLASIDVSANVTVDMDLSDAKLDSAAVQTLQGYLEEGSGASLSFGSIALYLVDYASTQNGGVGTFGGNLSSFTVNELWHVSLYVIIALLATVVLLLFNGFFARSLMKCKSPFDERVIKDANTLSYFFVLWGIVLAITLSLIKGFFTGIVKIDITLMIIIALSMLVFFLIRVFVYSSEFQN